MGTSLFYIDYGLDTLVKTANPNGGALETVGALGVNTSGLTGFDIFTDISGGNTAYALLTSGGIPSLYTVNFATGAATSIGAIGATRPFSRAIAQPVPEPGTASSASDSAAAPAAPEKNLPTRRAGTRPRVPALPAFTAFFSKRESEAGGATQTRRCGCLKRRMGLDTNRILHSAMCAAARADFLDRKSTRLNSSHPRLSRMPSSA